VGSDGLHEDDSKCAPYSRNIVRVTFKPGYRFFLFYDMISTVFALALSSHHSISFCALGTLQCTGTGDDMPPHTYNYAGMPLNTYLFT
jgi:hypothetical protein